MNDCCLDSTNSCTEQGRLRKGDSGSPVFDPTETRVYGYVTALNCFGELHIMLLQAVLDQIWNMIQPLNSSAKPRIFKLTEPDNLTNHHAVKSGRHSPVLDRLLQYWPEGLTVVPDMDPPELTVPPSNGADNEHSILKATVARLEDKDRSVRAAAVKALGKHPKLSDSTLQAVAARLKDEDWFVRDAVVETLGKQPVLLDNILEAVAARLEDDAGSVRAAAIEALGRQPTLSDNILEAVTARLEDKVQSVQAAAVRTLGKQPALSDNIFEAVTAQLEDEDGSVRAAAIDTRQATSVVR
jgi:hypothetical protein